MNVRGTESPGIPRASREIYFLRKRECTTDPGTRPPLHPNATCLQCAAADAARPGAAREGQVETVVLAWWPSLGSFGFDLSEPRTFALVPQISWERRTTFLFATGVPKGQATQGCNLFATVQYGVFSNARCLWADELQASKTPAKWYFDS